MSVATSLIEQSSARVAPAPAETLYQFNESPLLARQSRQESNARSYPRRIPWRSNGPRACMSKMSKGARSSTASPGPAHSRWATIIR